MEIKKIIDQRLDQEHSDENECDLCSNYTPGMLMEREDELNEFRDRMFMEQFFFGC